MATLIHFDNDDKIEEMAELLRHFPKTLCLDCYNDCEKVAKLLYEEGYCRHSITPKQVCAQVCAYLESLKWHTVEMLGDSKYMSASSFRYFMDLLIREIYKAGEKTDESKN